MTQQEDWEDVEREINSPMGAGSYFKPSKEIALNATKEYVFVSHMKWADTKYPIKDKEGKSLGYTWRFKLADGRVWDVSNANRKVLLNGLHPQGTKDVVAGRFKITNLGVPANKQPAHRVEYVGVATG